MISHFISLFIFANNRLIDNLIKTIEDKWEFAEIITYDILKISGLFFEDHRSRVIWRCSSCDVSDHDRCTVQIMSAVHALCRGFYVDVGKIVVMVLVVSSGLVMYWWNGNYINGCRLDNSCIVFVRTSQK